MISTANELASEAGREILTSGGSATDAAIAAQLVLGLVEPQSSGLGGGAFFVHWEEAGKALQTYDGRETAPAAAKLLLHAAVAHHQFHALQAPSR